MANIKPATFGLVVEHNNHCSIMVDSCHSMQERVAHQIADMFTANHYSSFPSSAREAVHVERAGQHRCPTSSQRLPGTTIVQKCTSKIEYSNETTQKLYDMAGPKPIKLHWPITFNNKKIEIPITCVRGFFN